MGRNVSRSSLARANGDRDYHIFEAYAYYLVNEARQKRVTDIFKLGGNVYAFDSTTIDLCLSVFWWAKFRKKKGGIKAHTIIRSEDNQPCFIRYTEAAKHDHLLLKEVNLPEDSILCFDKGYVDYAQYEVFTRKKIWYVTRLKDNALYQARKEFDIPDDADSGVLKDEEIELFLR